jgi:uncharacterized protein YndB with AHSA1/START domain
MTNGENGQLEQDGERCQLRFVRRLPHSPEKVWRALTEPGHLEAWFPTSIEGELAAGSALRFSVPGGEGDPFEGRMIACEPKVLLEFEWGPDDHLRFELQPDGDGTVLTFVDTFTPLGKAARDAAGWHSCFDLLAYHLDETTPPWGPGERWKDVHPGYVERFGPEASAIGPPAGAH